MTLDEQQTLVTMKTEIERTAACGSVKGSGFIFFEDDNDDTPKHYYPHENLAKSICSVCSSRGLCLEYSIKTNQEWGIWGGKTYPERRKMKKEMNKCVTI